MFASWKLSKISLKQYLWAGTETTALTLGWVFYLLSQHPDVAERIRREGREVYGNREPGWADVQKLTYTRAVMLETLRLYPPAWAEVASQGSLRGHWVVGVTVAPVRWQPQSGRLERARSVRFTLELEPGDPSHSMLERHRGVREIEARFEAGAARLIRGFQPAAAKGATGGASGKVGSGPAGPGPFQPTFRPTTDGSAVEYVVVTSDELEPEFERLAATLGGPLLRDKLWFFASVDNQSTTQRPEGVVQTGQADQLNVFGKLTWQVSER